MVGRPVRTLSPHRRYANPPIHEAICDFRFDGGGEWDPTIPGRLHVALDGAYAGRAQEQQVTEITVASSADRPPDLTFRRGIAKSLLTTPDGRRVVGVGPDVLSVHMLRPYQDPAHTEESGWDEFRRRIQQALTAYWKVARPRFVRRLAVRYINHILIDGTSWRLSDYFRCAHSVAEDLPDNGDEFMGRVRYSYPDGVRLTLFHGAIRTSEDRSGFLLDLDVAWEGTSLTSVEDAVARATDLRNRERSAFEAVITDKARELFDE